MDEMQILQQVHELIEQEHKLRAQVESGAIDPATEQSQLRAVEVALDQCWDLLRQRRARQDYGVDPDGAGTTEVRSESTVEGYIQ